jgi:hypothetical protein
MSLTFAEFRLESLAKIGNLHPLGISNHAPTSGDIQVHWQNPWQLRDNGEILDLLLCHNPQRYWLELKPQPAGSGWIINTSLLLAIAAWQYIQPEPARATLPTPATAENHASAMLLRIISS